jgi:hypothetical protein
VISLGDDATTIEKKEASNKKCNDEKNKKEC